MSDRPPENPGPSSFPLSGSPAAAPTRSLSEILEELAIVTDAHRGEASAIRGAVAELSRALASLFETIRADRADRASRVAELEGALQAARARIAELDGAEVEHAAPDPSDFDALRGAAERLRARTEAIVRDAGLPASDEVTAVEETEPPVPVEATDPGEALRLEAARKAVEASIAADAPEAGEVLPVDEDVIAGEVDEVTEELPAAPVHDEPFGKPGVLRVFPGAVLRQDLAEDLDIENELVFDEAPRRVAAAMPRPADEPSSPSERGDSADEPIRPTLSVRPRPEPIAIAPRPARKRRGLRRRRIDARKLRGVDPSAALRAMVASVDDLWSAGNPLDLVVALTDGSTLHVTGGDRAPLRVEEVDPGTSGRCTVTATSAQIVPLFGRLDLDDAQSAPLIHGSRRDADLLVGWIDRAQRLAVQPL